MTTPRDPLADALREALASERLSPGARAHDDALIARAIARATTTLAAASPSADASSKVATASVAEASKSASASQSVRVLALTARPSSRVFRVVLPLAAAFAASLAMAAVYVSSESPEIPEAPVETSVPEVTNPEPLATTTTNSPVETNADPSISVHDLPSAKTLAAVTSDTVSFSPPPPADSPVTAAELFRDANAERRAGHIEKASDLYTALQKRFPDAPETQASRVSLGRLLLDRQGNAAVALAQFDAYLAGAPADGGTLAEEARVGRALALEKLGRKADERRAWEELIARHPQSFHNARASERLEVLDR